MKRIFVNPVLRNFAMCLCVMAGIFLVGMKAYCESPSILERIQAAGASSSTSKLAALGAEVESLRSNDLTLYFQANDQLSALLEPLASTNAAGLAQLERLCEDALETKCPANAAKADLCINSKLEIARRFESTYAATIDRVRVLAGFLGEVRTIMITNYEEVLLKVGGVSPPIWPTNAKRFSFRFSGMDPKTIEDPQARGAYEQAIAENDRQNRQHYSENILQTETVPRVNFALTELFVNYAKSVFAQNSQTMNEAADLAKAAHLTAEEEDMMRSSAPSPSPMWYRLHSPR